MAFVLNSKSSNGVCMVVLSQSSGATYRSIFCKSRIENTLHPRIWYEKLAR